MRYKCQSPIEQVPSLLYLGIMDGERQMSRGDHQGEFLISQSGKDHPQTEEIIEQLSTGRFSTWFQKRQYRQNIRNGQAYFNGMGKIPAPDRHSPSSLLQCHRKTIYRQLNAPEEQDDPNGIFWFGTMFEEELLLPFLRDAITDEEAFVSNSLWVDYTQDTPAGELQIKGSTDPVLVDADGVPILPTEIKTKSSVEDLNEPNDHHLAQLHAYLIGLNEKYDCDLTEGVLIYGARQSLNITIFDVAFDPEFWKETVLDWAARHTQYRLDETLPPADPEYDWECGFCDYRHRCGESNGEYSDHGPKGLLAGFTEYPRQKVIEYLEANPEESLTPALAQAHPDLAEIYGVQSWHCEVCESTIDGDTVDDADEPLCPRCAERGELSSLFLPQQEEWNSSTESNSGHS